MPTYEYICMCCDHGFECEQSIKDEPLDECPQCLVASLKRVINNQSGFILKGGGWYSDLYASTKPAQKKKD